MTNGRVCSVPGLDAFRVTPASYYSTATPGGAAGGPAGSASMVFFIVMVPTFDVSAPVRMFFGRSNLANAGWGFYSTTGAYRAFVANGTPAPVEVSLASLAALEGERVPYLMLANYQNGVLQFWVNGVLAGTTTLGVGFTPYAGPTSYGVRSSSAVGMAVSELLSEAGFLNAYDPAAFASSIYGNGVAGLSAMWNDDLRNGRYLTWPRGAAVNSDWYWSARDVAAGSVAKATWPDRLTGTNLLRTGQPQGASFPARPG